MRRPQAAHGMERTYNLPPPSATKFFVPIFRPFNLVFTILYVQFICVYRFLHGVSLDPITKKSGVFIVILITIRYVDGAHSVQYRKQFLGQQAPCYLNSTEIIFIILCNQYCSPEQDSVVGTLIQHVDVINDVTNGGAP